MHDNLVSIGWHIKYLEESRKYVFFRNDILTAWQLFEVIYAFNTINHYQFNQPTGPWEIK